MPYAGDGYAMLLPGKWNPSKEREFAGMDVRCVLLLSCAQHSSCPLGARAHAPRARSYEDNFDAVNNLFVLVKPAEKSKMEARRRSRFAARAICRAPRSRRLFLPGLWLAGAVPDHAGAVAGPAGVAGRHRVGGCVAKALRCGSA